MPDPIKYPGMSALPDLVLEAAFRSGPVWFNAKNDIPNAYLKDNAGEGPYFDANDLHKVDGATHQICLIGDSITESAGATFGYAWQLLKRLRARGVIANYKVRAINGQGLGYVYPNSAEFSNLATDAATSVIPLRNAALKNRLFIFAGTNDIYLNAKTGAQTYALLTPLIDAAIAAGWLATEIYVMTMLPRQLNNAERGNYNTAIMGDAGARGYRKVPLHLNAAIGLDNCQNDATYYQGDKTHPTNAGHTVIATEADTVFVA